MEVENTYCKVYYSESFIFHQWYINLSLSLFRQITFKKMKMCCWGKRHGLTMYVLLWQLVCLPWNPHCLYRDDNVVWRYRGTQQILLKRHIQIWFNEIRSSSMFDDSQLSEMFYPYHKSDFYLNKFNKSWSVNITQRHSTNCLA